MSARAEKTLPLFNVITSMLLRCHYCATYHVVTVVQERL